MAGQFDSINRMPVWQKLVAFVFIGAMIIAAWYFVFWTVAEEGLARAQADLDKAIAERDGLVERKKNFLEEQKADEAREREVLAKMEVLPMSSTTIDNLMQTFQQEANYVGFSVDSWTKEPEEKQDFYARLPVKVQGAGTWSQTAEFFRKITELKQIVSVENLSMSAKRTSDDPDGHPKLQLEFEVATYRFLSEDERAAGGGGGGSKPGSKRSRTNRSGK